MEISSEIHFANIPKIIHVNRIQNFSFDWRW